MSGETATHREHAGAGREKCHVLYVDHTVAIGGAELSLEGLVTGLPGDRYRCTVVLPGAGPFDTRLRAQGVRVEHLGLESWRWWLKSRVEAARFVLTIHRQVASLRRWMRFFEEMRPDIVHFNINRIVEPVVAAHLLRLPSVVHFRDIPSAMTRRFALGGPAFFRIMNMADRWIANSHATAAAIEPHARGSLHVVPNGIRLQDFDRVASTSSKTTDAERGFRVAMVGGLVPWKHHDAYFRTAREVCRRRDDVQFLVAGDGRPSYVRSLHDQVAELGIADRVEFLGHVDDIPSLLATIDLLVHTMPAESFGRVFVEAMAAKIPVVAFRGGGANEVIVDGDTGVLVEPDDVSGMATAVDELLDDADRRHAMGEAGRRRVEACYTVERHCRLVADVYDEIIAEA